MQTPIDLIILAGGAGTRMGGIDKGLMPVGGRPAAQHLAETLLRPGDHLLVSANRNREQYQALGATVVADMEPDQGPLGGLRAAIPACRHEWQLVVPCDMPWLPVLTRDVLLASAEPDSVSVLHDGTRQQPLCLALAARHWQQSLSAYLDSGQRSARGWLAQCHTRACHLASNDTRAFLNLNSPDDLPG